jgi:hypothetical protein
MQSGRISISVEAGRVWTRARRSEYWRFLLKLLLVFAKMRSQHWFWDKRNFFRQNWHKSQKIVIITSTPDLSTINQSPVNAKNYSSSKYNAWSRPDPGRLTRPTSNIRVTQNCPKTLWLQDTLNKYFQLSKIQTFFGEKQAVWQKNCVLFEEDF